MNAFTQFLNDLIGKVGLGTLADQIGVDPAALSRFRSDQGNLSLKAIDNILELSKVAIIPRADLRKMEEALEIISDLWKAERKRNVQNGNGTRKTEG